MFALLVFLLSTDLKPNAELFLPEKNPFIRKYASASMQSFSKGGERERVDETQMAREWVRWGGGEGGTRVRETRQDYYWQASNSHQE